LLPRALGMQHILFIVNNYAPRVGGVETHVANLARELVLAGHRATVVSLDSTTGDAMENGVRVVRLRAHLPVAGVISFPALGTGRKLARKFASDDVTIVSTHTRFFPMSIVGVMVAEKLSVPAIHTEHGAGFVQTPSKTISVLSRLVDVTLGRLVLRRARAVLAVSEEVASFVDRLSGVTAQIFHNAINIADWKPTTAEVEAAVEVSRKLTFLSRIVPGKGWDEFLDVAAAIHAEPRFSDVKFEIIGDGSDMPKLRERVIELGLGGFAVIHGFAGIETIRPALRGAILVNPTRLAEGFQLTLIEAAIAGSQIVSYPAPGLSPLSASAAPVWAVAEKTTDALIRAVTEALDVPLPPFSLQAAAQWTWASRAGEYAKIARLLGEVAR